MIQTEDVKEYLAQCFDNADISVKSWPADGQHFAVKIASKDFAGKSKIEQHRLVLNILKKKYKIGEEMHAVQLNTTIKE